jgi:hypothetical protein
MNLPARLGRIPRDAWLTAALLLVVGALGAAAAAQNVEVPDAPALVSTSHQPDGASALRRWLLRLGYQVELNDGSAFDIPAETRLLLMLEPSESVEEDEWQQIARWVEQGGRLVIAGESWVALNAARSYDLNPRPLNPAAQALSPQHALFNAPPLELEAPLRAGVVYQPERQDYVSHFGLPDGPVMVSLQLGSGWILFSSTAYPFTNAGLKEPGAGALMLNLLRLDAERGTIVFDEWHHGLRTTAAAGPASWLRETPAGQALLYAGAVLLAALALSGRAFGRPIPAGDERGRRSPLEYINAMANLSRRAGHRRATLLQYRQALKRALGRRYRLDPGLPDDRYADELLRLNSELDAAALRRLLVRLANPAPNEADLVAAAGQCADWIERYDGRPAQP